MSERELNYGTLEYVCPTAMEVTRSHQIEEQEQIQKLLALLARIEAAHVSDLHFQSSAIPHIRELQHSYHTLYEKLLRSSNATAFQPRKAVAIIDALVSIDLQAEECRHNQELVLDCLLIHQEWLCKHTRVLPKVLDALFRPLHQARTSSCASVNASVRATYYSDPLLCLCASRIEKLCCSCATQIVTASFLDDLIRKDFVKILQSNVGCIGSVQCRLRAGIRSLMGAPSLGATIRQMLNSACELEPDGLSPQSPHPPVSPVTAAAGTVTAFVSFGNMEDNTNDETGDRIQHKRSRFSYDECSSMTSPVSAEPLNTAALNNTSDYSFGVDASPTYSPISSPIPLTQSLLALAGGAAEVELTEEQRIVVNQVVKEIDALLSCNHFPQEQNFSNRYACSGVYNTTNNPPSVGGAGSLIRVNARAGCGKTTTALGLFTALHSSLQFDDCTFNFNSNNVPVGAPRLQLTYTAFNKTVVESYRKKAVDKLNLHVFAKTVSGLCYCWFKNQYFRGAMLNVDNDLNAAAIGSFLKLPEKIRDRPYMFQQANPIAILAEEKAITLILIKIVESFCYSSDTIMSEKHYPLHLTSPKQFDKWINSVCKNYRINSGASGNSGSGSKAGSVAAHFLEEKSQVFVEMTREYYSTMSGLHHKMPKFGWISEAKKIFEKSKASGGIGTLSNSSSSSRSNNSSHVNRRSASTPDHISLTHGVVEKVCQLQCGTLFDPNSSEGRLGLVVVDEATDINSCQFEILNTQRKQQGTIVLMVGDAAQAIYQFRGASNQFRDARCNIECSLTHSFRFGPSIAHAANVVLALEVMWDNQRKHNHLISGTIETSGSSSSSSSRQTSTDNGVELGGVPGDNAADVMKAILADSSSSSMQPPQHASSYSSVEAVVRHLVRGNASISDALCAPENIAGQKVIHDDDRDLLSLVLGLDGFENNSYGGSIQYLPLIPEQQQQQLQQAACEAAADATSFLMRKIPHTKVCKTNLMGYIYLFRALDAFDAPAMVRIIGQDWKNVEKELKAGEALADLELYTCRNIRDKIDDFQSSAGEEGAVPVASPSAAAAAAAAAAAGAAIASSRGGTTGDDPSFFSAAEEASVETGLSLSLPPPPKSFSSEMLSQTSSTVSGVGGAVVANTPTSPCSQLGCSPLRSTQNSQYAEVLITTGCDSGQPQSQQSTESQKSCHRKVLGNTRSRGGSSSSSHRRPHYKWHDGETFYSLEEAEAYAEMYELTPLMLKVQIAKLHILNRGKRNLTTLLKSRYANRDNDPSIAVKVVTCHKAKGLEWDNVSMADDFDELLKVEFGLFCLRCERIEEKGADSGSGGTSGSGSSDDAGAGKCNASQKQPQQQCCSTNTNTNSNTPTTPQALLWERSWYVVCCAPSSAAAVEFISRAFSLPGRRELEEAVAQENGDTSPQLSYSYSKLFPPELKPLELVPLMPSTVKAIAALRTSLSSSSASAGGGKHNDSGSNAKKKEEEEEAVKIRVELVRHEMLSRASYLHAARRVRCDTGPYAYTNIDTGESFNKLQLSQSSELKLNNEVLNFDKSAEGQAAKTLNGSCRNRMAQMSSFFGDRVPPAAMPVQCAVKTHQHVHELYVAATRAAKLLETNWALYRALQWVEADIGGIGSYLRSIGLKTQEELRQDDNQAREARGDYLL